MKLCTCRNCDKQFYVSKNRPFCSRVCRLTYNEGDNRVGSQKAAT